MVRGLTSVSRKRVIVIPTGNMWAMRNVKIAGRPTNARITATLKALQSHDERIERIDIMSVDSSCVYMALSDRRIWFGMPGVNGVITYRYREVSALAITDPLGDDAVWLKITTSGVQWSINVGDAEHAMNLFKHLSNRVYPTMFEPDDE